MTEEAQIISLTEQLTEMMISGDIAGLNTILDENFTLTHITGYVQPKDEWLNEIATESMKYFSAETVKNKVEINGDQAEFIGQNLLDARIWGHRNLWRLQQKMTLTKQNGKWIILKSVASIF